MVYITNIGEFKKDVFARRRVSSRRDELLSGTQDRQFEWRCLDREAEIAITERNLPHWEQAGILTFVTFRLADSMPREIVDRWLAEQKAWLDAHNYSDLDIERAAADPRMPMKLRREYRKLRQQRWQDSLDDCHGTCILRFPNIAKIVAKTLTSFDDERYDLDRFVVMPNHVHVLVQMRTGWSLRKQCESWLRFSARSIHELIGGEGTFWQTEPFDHIVRSAEQLEYLRDYIVDNPKKAGLKPSEYLIYMRDR